METGASKAVFLSYASQDAEAAQRLADALCAAGVEVWFDQSELRGGDAWDQKIRQQVQTCALFLPVISANTQTRLEGYFRIEWNLAAQRTHAMAAARPFLIPVVIDATRDAEAHVPPEFKAVQWTRLRNGETAQAFVARIQGLLASGLVAGTPDLTATRGVVAEEKPGDRLGHYHLVDKIGEGGCGTVWQAEQEHPVRRRVALKVIKLGMDTKEVVARFEAERQALALMDHPNIAKVYDAGITETGRPYFVMEFVRGVTITSFCDEKKLSTAARLELFIQVCHAVQHAHQKGIIHRDIKPSNILVGLHDDQPVPKVIDFGIAKATAGRLTDQTLYTAVEQFIGTPAYMSPEQAQVSAIDIDTRSDVYSLGVLLYELLTGRTPFDTAELLKVGIDEMRRHIREVDPPRPSTRLSTMRGEALDSTAHLRQTAPPRLIHLVRGDLDWIVMRCLEKDRVRRYLSANGISDDIHRYLQHEPVSASPPSTAYRMRKLIRRNRFVFASAAAVFGALLIGATVATWQAVRARQAERMAQGSQERAEDLLAFMLGDLRPRLAKLSRLDLLESVADKAMAYFASLRARDQTDRTLALQAKTLTQIGALRTTQRKYDEAMAAYAVAYERAAALAARHPKDTTMLSERALVEFGIGVVHRNRGALEAAQEWLTRYRDTALALVALEPAKPAWQLEAGYGLNNLAVLKKDRGDLEGARADFTSKLAILNKLLAASPADSQLKSSVATTNSFLGSLAEQQGDFPSALAYFSAESRTLDELQRADPQDMNIRFERAKNLSIQTGVLLVIGRQIDAARCLGEGRKLIDGLTGHDPDNLDWENQSQKIRLREAGLARMNGNLAEAQRLVSSARLGLEEMRKKAQGSGSSLQEIAAALRLEAETTAATDLARAGELIAQAQRLGEQVLAATPWSGEVTAHFAQTLVVAARIASDRGSGESSRACAQRAWDLLAPRVGASNDWHLLDPAVRALALLGQSEQKALLQSRATRLGYVPVTPWP